MVLVSNGEERLMSNPKLFILCQPHGKTPRRVRGKNSADKVGVEIQFSRIPACRRINVPGLNEI
jgi:hypothetical protein